MDITTASEAVSIGSIPIGRTTFSTRIRMILVLLLVSLSASAHADTLHLKDGGDVRGTVTKDDPDAVEIIVKKEFVDPDNWSKVAQSQNAGLLILRNGLVVARGRHGRRSRRRHGSDRERPRRKHLL